MKHVKALLVTLLMVGCGLALHWRIAPLPPLAPFFNPFSGFWQNAEPAGNLPFREMPQGLTGQAEVLFDSLLIPHIFAANDYDLYFLQGYTTAALRLWQMEFQTHAAAGRVAEIIGADGVSFDRRQRRHGMVFASQNFLAAAEQDPVAFTQLKAYADGVNAWIASLSAASLPLEYKLLGYQPEPWTHLKTALLLKYMASDLSMWDVDLEYTNALRLFGKETFNLLYPDVAPGQEPVVKGKTWNFTPLKVSRPDSLTFPLSFSNGTGTPVRPNPDNGSNNWAVGPSKTADGSVILCSDPHLALNLPSIWMGIQLTAPGVNVKGVSIPGAPNVIIGFNDSVAWGVTNARRDVVDWYHIQFENQQKDRYLHDGQWKPTTKTIEQIRIRGGETFADTVVYTHHGPVTYDDSFNEVPGMKHFAMRWIAHDPSLEVKTFYELNRARNYQDYQNALKYYVCPAQNFVFGSAAGDVAMWVQGKFPVKWPEQGKFLMDGSRSDMEWQAYIPQGHNVHSVNPSRGFVSSANQHPVDEAYPYYVFDPTYEYFRNRRINRVLDSLKGITVAQMKALQFDDYNLTASEMLPVLLGYLNPDTFTPEQKAAVQILQKWDYHNTPEAEGASYFEAWYDEIRPMVWDELTEQSTPLYQPEEYLLIRLLKNDTTFRFFDIVSTPEKETAREVVQRSFEKSLERIAKWKEKRRAEGYADTPVEWASYKNTYVQHLARLRPFSLNIRTGGNHNIVNATSERHGASWRMVVQLGPKGSQAWGIYPGGQSGNPGSPHYLGMLNTWAGGNYADFSLRTKEQLR